jgi:hypothetical protein
MRSYLTLSLCCIAVVCTSALPPPCVAQDDRFVIYLNGSHGYISRTGELIIPPILEGTYVIHFGEGMAMFSETVKPKPDTVPFIDDDGRIHSFPIQKWGFINTSGEKVIPAKYDAAQGYHEGFAAVGFDTDQTRYDCLHCDANRRWGFIDITGKLVIAAQFDSVDRFSEGLAAVQNAKLKWGYIDRSGHLVIPFQFENAAAFSEGLAVVGEGKKFGFINRTGGYVVPLRFTEAEEFSNGLAPVRLGGKRLHEGEMLMGPVGGRWAFIDSKGEIKVKLPKQVTHASPYREGRAAVEFGASCGYVNTSGAVIVPPRFRQCDDFSEGLARVLDETWQYIDEAGRVVLRVNYSQVGPFVNGLASVTLGEVGPTQRFGYINKDGVEVYKPKPAL